MAVMARREGETPLSGRVEMDDAYLGGGARRRQAGPGRSRQDALRGRSLDQPRGPPTQGEADPGHGFRKRAIARGAKRWLDPGTEVVTDGLNCWNALGHAGYTRRAIRTGSGRKAACMAPFKWVNTSRSQVESYG